MRKAVLSKTKASSAARRNFLRGGVAAGAGAAVAAAVPGIALGSQPEPEAAVGKDESYRLTSHIADYYRTL